MALPVLSVWLLTTTVLQNRLAERMLALAQDQNAMPLDPKNCCTTSSSSSSSWAISPIWHRQSHGHAPGLFSAEAALHSYHDTFILIGWISAAGILPALWMGHTTAKPAQTAPPRPNRPYPIRRPQGARMARTSIVGAEKRKMEWLDHIGLSRYTTTHA